MRSFVPLIIAMLFALALGGCEVEREPSPTDPDETAVPHDPHGR